MGNLFGKKELIGSELDELIDERIFSIIDKNNDNIVSKEEFNIWNENTKNKISKIKNKYDKIIKNFEQTLSDKDNEIDNLRLVIKNLEDDKSELQELVNNNIQIDNVVQQNIISKNKIREYVKDVLKNENINIKHFPDYVEETIYTNVLYLVFKMITYVSDNSELNIVNHKLKFVIN